MLAALVVISTGFISGCNDASLPAAEAGEGGPEQASDSGAIPVDTALDFLRDREVFLPQLAGGDDGSLFLVWNERSGERGADLFIAQRAATGAFGPPVRINDEPESVGGPSFDEGRPAVAVGTGGVIAVAWTAWGESGAADSRGRGAGPHGQGAPGVHGAVEHGQTGGREGHAGAGHGAGATDIRAAISRDGGNTFEPSVVLNSDAGASALRGFVDVDVDAAGVVHAAWIDGRFAPRGTHEPAELFYARVDDGEVTEINLTADQQDSICDCCRIDVDVRADDRVVIAFRNTGGGYRDIFRIETGPDRAFGRPARLGPPMWELNGCPMIGPLNVGEATLWSEASTGKRRILAATNAGGAYEVVVEDAEDWALERPPRLVVGSPPDAPLLLLPGRPEGLLLRGSGLEWTVATEGIPRWAMSAALVDGEVILLGSLDGELLTERRALGF
jgi:hypothetical protein